MRTPSVETGALLGRAGGGAGGAQSHGHRRALVSGKGLVHPRLSPGWLTGCRNEPLDFPLPVRMIPSSAVAALDGRAVDLSMYGRIVWKAVERRRWLKQQQTWARSHA